jgi:hypothetical protein
VRKAWWLKDCRELQRKKKHIKLQNEIECRNLKEKITRNKLLNDNKKHKKNWRNM